MLHRIKLAALIALTISNSIIADRSVPHISFRSQGVNAARDLIGWEEFINQCDKERNYGALGVTLEYDRSFRPGNIAECLFNGDVVSSHECAFLSISGSRAQNRGSQDWLADYFGLPTDFASTITFKPTIKNIIVDVALYLGLDSWVPGLYARFDLPLTNSRWNLCYKETVTNAVINAGTNDYTEGYFTSDLVPNVQLLKHATDFFTGSVNHNLTNEDGSTVIFNRLSASRWNPCNQELSETRFADIALTLGYNFICTDDCHFGINTRLSIPTGNKPCGEFLFEPMVGNGGHLEWGGGISCHTTIWESSDSDAALAVYLDGNITHLFRSHQTRVFDLCHEGPNSRYMLALKMESQTNGLEGSVSATTPDFTTSRYQFADEFSPVANLTKRKVSVTAAIQADIALKFSLINGSGLSWDLGYNFWARSCEKICVIDDCCLMPFDGKTWALKGDAQVYGFIGDEAVALAPSDRGATIQNGTNDFVPGADTAVGNVTAITNPNIDNPQFAYQDGVAVNATPGGTNHTHTSIQPIFLQESNLDVNGTTGISNKVFTHISYAWVDRNENWAPFVGVGGSAEFAIHDCDAVAPTCTEIPDVPCATCCVQDCCQKCAVSQWGIWIKTGVAFH